LTAFAGIGVLIQVSIEIGGLDGRQPHGPIASGTLGRRRRLPF
jgi:hypothetical protein